jgi:hypothetical protein
MRKRSFPDNWQQACLNSNFTTWTWPSKQERSNRASFYPSVYEPSILLRTVCLAQVPSRSVLQEQLHGKLQVQEIAEELHRLTIAKAPMWIF